VREGRGPSDQFSDEENEAGSGRSRNGKLEKAGLGAIKAAECKAGSRRPTNERLGKVRLGSARPPSTRLGMIEPGGEILRSGAAGSDALA
jgi:hypothetical protein